VAILTSDKVDFKPTFIKWDKKGHLIPIKGAIYQKKITFISLYAPSVSALNFVKHKLKDIKAYLDSNTVVVAIPLLGIYLKECESAYSKDNCTPMFIAALFTIAKL
jgi:hypothetical protein